MFSIHLSNPDSNTPICVAGMESTCWLPTSWSPRLATTTWPLLLTSLLSPLLVPTWTCAPLMTSPSLWMPWCTTLTLTMRRWRLPTQLSCSTATSLMAAAWCALSWPWPSETTRVVWQSIHETDTFSFDTFDLSLNLPIRYSEWINSFVLRECLAGFHFNVCFNVASCIDL